MEWDRLPEGWEIKRLGDILTLIQNGITARQNTNHIGYPVSRIETIQQSKFDENRIRFVELTLEDFDKYKYEIGDIAFSHINSFELVGKVAIYNGHPNKLIHGMNLLRLRVNKQLCHPAFLYHFLQSGDARLQLEPKIKRAINQASVNQQNVKSLEIPLPPLSEQHRIVARIEELTSRIEEAKGLRLAAQKETESIMPSALHEVFSQGEKEGWEISKLPDAAEINPTYHLPNDSDGDPLFPFLPMANVSEVSGSIDKFEQRTLSRLKRGKTRFQSSDILFAKITPCVENGKVALAPQLDVPVAFASTEFHIIKPRQQVIPKFTWHFLRSKSVRDMAVASMTGSTGRQRVPKEFLVHLEIPLPPLSEQRRIVAYLDRLQARVNELRRLQQETQREINSMTSAVLDKAFRGEL